MRATAVAGTAILAAGLSAQEPATGSAPTSPELDALIAPGAKVEKLAGDFGFVEGPVWHRDGYLLFSDIPRNKIMKWHPKDGVSVYREPSGQSNGLAFDAHGELFAAEHANRRISRGALGGEPFTVAESYQSRRLNSPNDLIITKDGTLYFTDPPYGLPNQSEGKEQPVNGVYRIGRNGVVVLIAEDFERPNGLALSPDGRTLYVADTARGHTRAFDVSKDGRVSNGREFATMKAWAPDVRGAPDGLKVDTKGHVYVTGAGGVWVYDKSGSTLGVIQTPEIPANCAFGDADRKSLYITARTGLYRIRLTVKGL